MRRLGGVVAVLMLAACNAGSGDPGLALPLTAPEGADPIVKDFIEVCSLALKEGTDAGGEAMKRGWAPEVDQMALALSGTAILRKDTPDGMLNLQIYDINFPHLHSRSCMVMRLNGAAKIDTSAIAKIPGVRGDRMTAPAGVASTGARGLWSFISGGEVVTLTTIETDNYVQFTMGTSRRLTPKPDVP